MGTAAELARKYLQDKQIPALFETMMTGLMYNKPEDPVDFMLRALHAIRRNPGQKVTWDAFVENPPPPIDAPPSRPGSSRKLMETRLSAVTQDPVRRTPPPKSADGTKPPSAKAPSRPSSVLIRSRADRIDVDRPLVLLFGGPGGGKTDMSAKVVELMDDPVGHVVMSKSIKRAIEKYDAHPEWREAASKFENGEPIDDSLALAVLKSEIAALKNDNSIILLEGYPKDLNQVAEFEREIRRVDKAVIIDFDEGELKARMLDSGLSESVIENRLSEYKNKTLPTAKYFDDRLILQLIPGEQPTEAICNQLKDVLISVLYPTTASSDPVKIETELNEASMVEEETIDRRVSKQANVILVVGAPGSLKSEYCKRIAQQFDGFVHLSMGALLREGAKQNADDETWRNLHERMKTGEHIPTELCKDVIYESMAENSTAFGFVIEGYPRDVGQAQDFEKTIDRVDLVLLIDCTEQFCANTLRMRSDDDGGKRADDSPQAIKLRISNFKQHTLPMLKYFDEKGKLKVVEGDKGVDAVYDEVSKMIEEIFIPQESGEGKSLESSKNSK